MDAGPSHTLHRLSSSESEEYSDADSEFEEEDSMVDGDPQDGVFVEARAAASDYSDEYDDETPDRSDKGKGAAHGTRRHNGTQEHAPHHSRHKSEDSRSWSDLDVSMIIALLSPVGNWLTGGDHVKNLFLLLLLVFYLHQLIEGELFSRQFTLLLTCQQYRGDFTRALGRTSLHALPRSLSTSPTKAQRLRGLLSRSFILSSCYISPAV